MRCITMAGALAACLLLTSCAGSDNDAKASASSKATATHAPTSPAPLTSQEAAEAAAEKAKKDFDKSLKGLDNALGETLGIQESTYEATDTQPDYENMFRVSVDVGALLARQGSPRGCPMVKPASANSRDRLG
ncbi:hypothetical protein [Streptomyces sp. NPDC096324]|uniref:hypothetical protein n=1 Tax=Streptomyces sp. NPDC096324 TaxID=3366085 RepID=UPI003805848A